VFINKFRTIPFQFVLQLQILHHITKAELNFTYFLLKKIFFMILNTDVPFSSVGFPEQIQHTTPIQFTALTCSQMHYFQFIFVVYLALYISSVY